MKKNKKLFFGLILIIYIFINIIGCDNVESKTENMQERVITNKEIILQIQFTKEQIHNTANALRQEYVYDEELISALANKWKELDIREHELNEENIKLEKEIEKSKKRYMGTFEATAYCITGKTASGTYTTANRTIAVDPKVIPLGAKVYVEGYGTYIAEDTGSAVKGKIIDIYIPGYQNCINFGRRKVNVYLVD